MLEHVNLYNILFLDVETVPQYPSYKEVPGRIQQLWEVKAGYLKQEEDDTPATLYGRAGIYAEFGKIVCISTGFLTKQGGKEQLRIKSFYGDDEKQLLAGFADLLNNYFNKPDQLLCGHNAKEFDFPYICRRMLVNGIQIPSILNLSGKKPWEVQHLDTMQLWRFGDYKGYTSLDLLAAIFDIQSPKEDMSGADVGTVYWQDEKLDKIVEYCQNDVVCLVQVFRRYLGMELLSPENVETANP